MSVTNKFEWTPSIGNYLKKKGHRPILFLLVKLNECTLGRKRPKSPFQNKIIRLLTYEVPFKKLFFPVQLKS